MDIRAAEISKVIRDQIASFGTEAQVQPDILGGIVVKLGSQMIDASIRTKLNRLAQAMKGEARMPAAPMKG